MEKNSELSCEEWMSCGWMRIFLGVATVSAIEIPIDMWSEWRVA
jgi:hypothetical protein